MKISNNLLFVLLIGLTLGSCVREDSSSVDQDKIWTSYEMFYNANEDKTYARAFFRFSNATGTLLELVDEASITVNNEPMTWKPLLAFYEKEYAGLVSTGTFVYEDLDGLTFNNTAIIQNNIAFPGMDTISRSNAFDLQWVGSALALGESVVVTINGANEGDLQVFTQTNLASTSIILDKDKLSELPEGEADMWMDRTNVQNLSQGTSASGALTGRYRAENARAYFK